jgi:antitoxin (DNA-binding transcriptional repressor) of toxin-antitoxin stability system
MIQIQVNEFAQNIENILSKLEEGETYILTKEGKPVAEIHALKEKGQGWKRKVEKVKLLKNISAQSLIEEERRIK